MSVLIRTKLGLAAALSVGACNGAASEATPLPEGLELPAFEAAETDTDVENLSIAVSATDEAGLSAGQPGFAGPARSGECRVYLNNVAPITPVTSDELYDLSFKRLDAIVQRAGGVEALIADPDKIPAVHIWGDVNAPWRCVAGAIYNVQTAGYPTLGFLSTPTDIEGPPTVTQAAYIDLPFVPDDAEMAGPAQPKVTLTAVNEILWNGVPVDQQTLRANLRGLKKLASAPDSESVPVGGVAELEFEAEPNVSYDFAAKVLGVIAASKVTLIRFVGTEDHRSFEKASSTPTSHP
jgi:biopolymer transport protein ExbD